MAALEVVLVDVVASGGGDRAASEESDMSYAAG